MALLSSTDSAQVRKLFSQLTRDVHVRFYTQMLNCNGCAETEAILGELAGLTGRIRLEKINALTEVDRRQADGVEHVPAIIISDGTHDRVRLYGTPSGYEFTSLLTALMDTGSESATLEQHTLDFLAALCIDLRIRVFVTPTCPYCPRSAVLAMRMAQASPRVRAEVVEANDFPELSMRFGVQGVPRTVVNERFYAEGAISEADLTAALGRAALLPAEGPEIDLAALVRDPASE